MDIVSPYNYQTPDDEQPPHESEQVRAAFGELTLEKRFAVNASHISRRMVHQVKNILSSPDARVLYLTRLDEKGEATPEEKQELTVKLEKMYTDAAQRYGFSSEEELTDTMIADLGPDIQKLAETAERVRYIDLRIIDETVQSWMDDRLTRTSPKAHQ